MKLVFNALRHHASSIRGGVARKFTTEAPNATSLKLTFVSPHEKIMTRKDVYQVNIQASSGDMGILAQHVPCVEQLRPGLIEILSTPTSPKIRYFSSGGFAIVHPDSHLTINAIEAVPVEQLDVEAIKKGLSDWERKLATSSSNEDDKIRAEIGVEVHQAMLNAVSSL